MHLECNQPPWLNIVRTTTIKRLHPISKGPRCSTGRRYDHKWITCRKFGLAHLLNTTSFRQFQIVQTKAQTPTRIRSFIFLSIPFNQLPNRLVIFRDGTRRVWAWVEPPHTRTHLPWSYPSPIPIPVNGYKFFPYPSPARVNGYPRVKIPAFTTLQFE
jgi:hypothetical protein